MWYAPFTEEVFAILKPHLPAGTRLTSTYRSPGDQLLTIRDLAERYNHQHPATRSSLPREIQLDMPTTWLPALIELRRRGVAVNAPLSGCGIPVSPHTTGNVVFDMSGADLEGIEKGCRAAQKYQIMGFGQIKPEPANNTVHVRVSWVSGRALQGLYWRLGYATV
jgi:hypothetical protein